MRLPTLSSFFPQETYDPQRETKSHPFFFLGITFKTDAFLHFKSALSCGFLNGAVRSRLLPHQPMFFTSCDFEAIKNKGRCRGYFFSGADHCPITSPTPPKEKKKKKNGHLLISVTSV